MKGMQGTGKVEDNNILQSYRYNEITYKAEEWRIRGNLKVIQGREPRKQGQRFQASHNEKLTLTVTYGKGE